MFHEVGITVIGEAVGESPENGDFGFNLPQQQATGVRSDGSAVESGGDSSCR